MLCPRCEGSLTVSQRKGVEIDQCHKCRGVWLDRGELDKIIARYDAFDEDEERENRQYYRGHDDPRGGRKSFWQELFD